MGKGRLEALDSIAPLWPVFVSYILSFVIVGIYWNNHHHMLHAVMWFIPDRRFEPGQT